MVFMRETALGFVYVQYPRSQIYKITPKFSNNANNLQQNSYDYHYGQYHAHDSTYQSNRGSLFKLIETPSPFMIPKGKALRCDKTGRILFLSWGKGIRIFFNITLENKAENEGDLVQFDQREIDDFRIIGSDNTGGDPVGVLTACSNMLLYYHEVQKNKGI